MVSWVGIPAGVEPIPETREALDELEREGDLALREDLQRLADLARARVPGLVGVSLGLVVQDLVLTYVAGGIDVSALDPVQDTDDEPRVDAVRQRHLGPVDSRSRLGEGLRQPVARPSGVAGIRSSLSIPFRHNGVVTGGVDLYGDAPDTFRGRVQEMAALFGAWAPGAVADADLSFASRLEAAQGPTRLREQRLIDQAIGLLVAASSLDPVAAEERLHAAADQAGLSVGLLAMAIVEASTEPE